MSKHPACCIFGWMRTGFELIGHKETRLSIPASITAAPGLRVAVTGVRPSCLGCGWVTSLPEGPLCKQAATLTFTPRRTICSWQPAKRARLCVAWGRKDGGRRTRRGNTWEHGEDADFLLKEGGLGIKHATLFYSANHSAALSVALDARCRNP